VIVPIVPVGAGALVGAGADDAATATGGGGAAGVVTTGGGGVAEARADAGGFALAFMARDPGAGGT
jgi:hypothetical protein